MNDTKPQGPFSTSFYSYAIIVKRSLADKSYELIFCSLQRKIQHRYSLELTTQYISIQSNIFLNSSLERYQNSERMTCSWIYG